jgi:hypothetical protein
MDGCGCVYVMLKFLSNKALFTEKIYLQYLLIQLDFVRLFNYYGMQLRPRPDRVNLSHRTRLCGMLCMSSYNQPLLL